MSVVLSFLGAVFLGAVVIVGVGAGAIVILGVCVNAWADWITGQSR